MKEKLNQFSGKRGFNLPHVFDRTVIILLVVYGLVLAYELLVYTSSGYYATMFYFDEEYNNISIITFAAGILISLVQFAFLQAKTKCITILSFGESRKSLFRKKFWFPLLAMVLITIGYYIIILCTDEKLKKSFGVLADEYFGNIMISLLPLIVGYTAGAFSRIYCGKTSETIFFSASICAFPFTFFNLIDAIFALSLNGYYSIASDYWSFSNYNAAQGNDITTILSLFDPLYTLNYNVYGFVNEDMSAQLWYATPAHYIIKNLIWIGILVGIVFITEKYFVKKFSVEYCDKLGKSNSVRRMCFLTSALFISTLSLGKFFEYLLEYLQPIYMLLLLIIVLIISFLLAGIVALILYRKKEQMRFSLQSAGVVTVLCLSVYFISVTGCFGYSSYVPDTDKIKAVMIGDIVSLTPSSSLMSYFSPAEEVFGTDISFETKEDIELVKDVHKFIADDKKYNTTETFTIVYELENGEIIYRAYSYLSDEGHEKVSTLWETDAVREFYKTILNQNPEINSTSSNEEWVKWFRQLLFYGSPRLMEKLQQLDNDISCISNDSYKTVASADSLVIINKDSVATSFTNEEIEKETVECIKKALYDDLVKLSSKQFYKPQEQIGVISLSSCPSLLEYEKNYWGDYKKVTTKSVLESYKYNLIKFPVTTDMVNTIKVLKEFELYKWFDTDKKIKEAHLIDSQTLIEWMNSYNVKNSFVSASDGSSLSAVSYWWNDDEIGTYLEDGCGYTDGTDKDFEWYHSRYEDGIMEPISEDDIKIITSEDAKKLREKAFMTYNAGNDCEFLVMKYTDGTVNMLVISN